MAPRAVLIHPPEASGRLDPTKCRTVRPRAVQPHWTPTGRRALVHGPPSPRTGAPPVLRPKLVNRPPVGFSIGSTNKPASLDFSATACESPKAPPCIQSLEPSLLALHLHGGHPSNGPFALVLHLHRHQPCRPQHLHILSSSKASVHTTLSITHHTRKRPAVVRTHHWFSQSCRVNIPLQLLQWVIGVLINGLSMNSMPSWHFSRLVEIVYSSIDQVFDHLNLKISLSSLCKSCVL